MEDLELSTREKWLLFANKYKVELVILAVSILFCVCGIYVYLNNGSNVEVDNVQIETKELSQVLKSSNILIDLSGAVNNPGVYELKNNSRLKDLLEKAGGLSIDADSKYFQKNYNLARILVDQEKIYIPNKAEIETGIYLDGESVDQINPRIIQEDSSETSLINVNTGSSDELDSLPGVGTVISARIISARPYKTIEELKEKKIVNNSLFEKIKSLITIN